MADPFWNKHAPTSAELQSPVNDVPVSGAQTFSLKVPRLVFTTQA